MKNLFLNTFADVKGVTIGKAKQRISKMVWDVCKIKLQTVGYTSKELKEAYDIFCSIKLQGVYDSGRIEVEGHEYDFTKLLFA